MEATRVYTQLGDYNDAKLKAHSINYKGGINQLFEVQLSFTVLQAEDFEPDTLIGKSADINIQPDSHDPFYIKGVIQQCKAQDTLDALKQQQYQCIIVPKLALLAGESENYLYRDQQIFDLILFLLTGHTDNKLTLANGYSKKSVYDYQGFQNINGDSEIRFLLSHPQDHPQYPTFGQLIQTNQNALEFFEQLLPLNGLSFFFDHSKSNSPLVITDCMHDDSFRDPKTVSFQQAQQRDRLALAVYQHNTTTGTPISETYVRGYQPGQSSAIIQAIQPSTVPSPNNDPSTFYAPIIASTPAEAENLSVFYQGHFDAASQTTHISGQGLVYPGQLIKIENAPSKEANHAVYLTSLSWVLTMDSTAFHEIRTCNWHGQCVDNQYSFYALPIPFIAPDVLKDWQIETVVSGEQNLSDKDYNTLDQQGRYSISPPDCFNKLGGHKQCLLGLRLSQSFHSEDHKQSAPLAQGTWVDLGFEDGNLQRTVIEGSLNTQNHPILTDTANAQNMVFQDEKYNRLSFLSTGTFLPFSADGHQAATELYAPNYDGADSFSGLRMGDAVSSSQLGSSEPGVHWETSDKWREMHEDSHVELFGMLTPTNAKSQPTIPVYRLYTQLNPTEDYPYHRIESITPDEILKTFNIGGSSTSIIAKQDKQTLTQSAKAKQHQININNDEDIFVYQNVQESFIPGELVDATTHEHKVNDLTEKHLTQNHIVNVTADSYFEYYKSSHIEKHLHKDNVYSANNITFNEVVHNTTTTGLNISADETVYNATIINQLSTGTNTVTATKSMTQQGAVLNQFGETQVNIEVDPKEIKFEPNEKAVLTLRIQDRFAQTPDDVSCFDQQLQSARIKVIYSQQNTQTHETTPQTEVVTVNKYGVAYLYHLGTQDEPIYKDKVAYITQQIKIIILDLGYVDIGSTGQEQAVYITHVNQLPIEFESIEDIQNQAIAANVAKRPGNSITLTQDGWTKNPVKPFQPQGMTAQVEGVNEYSLALGILEPAILFNFRQDEWQAFLSGEDKETYETMQPYMAGGLVSPKSYLADITKAVSPSDTAQASLKPNEQFEDWMIESFKQNGANVTIAIHGYNVDLGFYPNQIESWEQITEYKPTGRAAAMKMSYYKVNIGTLKSTLALTEYEKEAARLSVSKKLPDETSVGTGAHKWQVQLENNLNQGAGFDGTKYDKYTRVIQVAWQGNPNPQDYMAAPPMSKFPAQKVFNLVKQLKQNGIKVNLIAHSLGNEVLIRTLDLCGQNGIQVDHAFMWEPAIPNTSFNTKKIDYLPMLINGKNIDYGYNFINAQKGLSKVTVLYSNLDNILGEIPYNGSLYNFDKIKANDEQAKEMIELNRFNPRGQEVAVNYYNRLPHDLTFGMVFKAILYDVGKVFENTDSSFAGNCLELAGDVKYLNEKPNNDIISIATDKMKDPGAGIAFAFSSLPLALLEPYIKHKLGDDIQFKSIYLLANLFTYPVSWIIESKQNIEQLYQQWREKYHYTHFQNFPLDNAATLDAQIGLLKTKLPEFYDELRSAVRLYDVIDAYAATSIFKNTDIVSTMNKVAKQTDEIWEAFITTFLTILMTVEAYPPEALGYKGAPDQIANAMGQKYNQTPQVDPTKPCSFNPNGTPVCVDHSAMLFPSEYMKLWVYKNYLFSKSGSKGGSFDQFGQYQIS